MTIRVGILGAGRIGRIHCHNLLQSPGVEVVALCDPFLDKTWALAQGIAHCLTDEEEFFRLDLHAVIIASPTTQHLRQIMRALDKKLHIFCEKPVDASIAAHDTIKDRLQNSNCKLQIGFNRRFDKDFSAIAHASHTGTLGTPYLVRITSRDPGLPSLDYLSSSGGMFFDMTIHDFDMARFIMNSNVSEVYARGAALVSDQVATINDIDTAVITLKFENGAFGIIDNSRQSAYGYDQRVELFGSLGSLSNNHHRQTSVTLSNQSGCHKEPMLNFFLERYQHSYYQEINSFLDHCRNNSSPKPDIDDARFAVSLAMAAKESMLTNQPVRVSTS